MTALVWFRNDLRVADNPALHAALADKSPVHACFCLSWKQWRVHDVGDRRIAFVLRCLQALEKELAERGIRLVCLQASEFSAVPEAIVAHAQSIGADTVFWNAEYPVNERRRDVAVTKALSHVGIARSVHHGTVVLPPGSVRTGSDGPYTVFTPFKRRWFERLTSDDLTPIKAARRRAAVAIESSVPRVLDGAPVSLEADVWPGGEREAIRRLEQFINDREARYADDRDLPAVEGTSRLSPYLSVGAISARQCLATFSNGEAMQASAWVNELIWRDFYRHVIDAFPHVSYGFAFRREYDQVRWRDDPESLAAWQAGQTGYPLVDAAMRQLNATGWMHNRLRMVVAMFLSKHLLIDWREGERYFMQQLVDGDFAANNGGWQWSASTGTDAAPYFRIFNPTGQGKKFDPKGEFVRRWVPELGDVDQRFLFEPWNLEPAPQYPAPIVEHKAARERALAAFKMGD